MLYRSTLGLVRGLSAVWIDMKYREFIGELLAITATDGRLDLLVLATPDSVLAVQRIVRTLYQVAETQARTLNRESIEVTVLVDGLDVEADRDEKWEVIAGAIWESDLISVFRRLYPEASYINGLPEVIMGSSSRLDAVLFKNADGMVSDLSPPQSVLDEEDRQEIEEVEHLHCGNIMISSRGWEHNVVAVGGTFDHLHAGHKLLLTVAGYLAKEQLIVGITGPKLLVNKKYADAMQSFDFRETHVKNFVERVFPHLSVETTMINDIYGPTASNENIDALVVSTETLSGGGAVNKFRKEKGWNELVVYEVDLIGSHNEGAKLSSTDLRKRELEERERGSKQSAESQEAEVVNPDTK